jgi:branched-chain amino acid transport system permease protein
LLEKARPLRWPLLAIVLLPLIVTGCSGRPLTVGTLVEQLLIGLILGSVYALIALGYTLVYGVIKLINFAHGDIYMVGAFVGFYSLRFFIRALHFTNGVSLVVCFALSVIVSAALCATLAVIIERLAYRPLRNSSRIAALITAVGVSFLLENLGIIVFGANPKSYEPKTLAVYQLQQSAAADFSGGSQEYELHDVTQRAFSPGQAQNSFFRVRLVTPKGASDWGPVLEVTSGSPSGFVEASPAATEASIPAPASIGYTTQKKSGAEQITVSWAAGQPTLTRLNPVFSDVAGRPLAFELPFMSAAGEPVRMPYFNVVILVITLATLWALNLLINRSMFGISMRALSFDLNAAKLMGVNTDAVIAWTFAIGGAAAAIAGNMVGLYNQTIDPLMGILPGLKAFVAAVVGGIGSIPGAAVGGLIMGISEALVKALIPSQYSSLADAFAFALLIVVLLFKPTGIFGRTVKEKV